MPAASDVTLTATLRRLAAGAEDGVVSVASPGGTLTVTVEGGVPVAAGPAPLVAARLPGTPSAAVRRAAETDAVVDLLVDAAVGPSATITVTAGGSGAQPGSVPLPSGTLAEIERRAVHTAGALQQHGPDAVLTPTHRYEVRGEAGRLLREFDGERSLTEIATEAGLPLGAVARLAAVLVDSGGLTGATAHHGGSISSSYLVDDDRDDEPEPWVMGSPTDDEPDEAPTAEAHAPTVEAHAPEPAEAHTPPVEAHAPEPAGALAPEPLTSTLLADDVVGDDWADTAWLDELDREDEPQEPPTAPAAGTPSVHEAAGSDTPVAAGTAAADDPAEDRTEHVEPVPSVEDEPAQQRSRAQPGEVAEFLRELSRLALDED